MPSLYRYQASAIAGALFFIHPHKYHADKQGIPRNKALINKESILAALYPNTQHVLSLQ